MTLPVPALAALPEQLVGLYSSKNLTAERAAHTPHTKLVYIGLAKFLNEAGVIKLMYVGSVEAQDYVIP